ncbi:MAG: IS701 family transposase [bacterium]
MNILHQWDKISPNGSLKSFLPIDVQLVETMEQESYWKHLIRTYHYLSFKWSAGLSLKYLVFSKGSVIAALSWNSGVYKLKLRDQLLFSYGLERATFPYQVITNTRFLILPWIQVANLASHILSCNIKRLVHDWKNLFNHKPVLLETFVDPNYFKGTCYQASNWVFLGFTQGSSKCGKHYYYHGKKKAIFVYPLNARMRKILLTMPPPEILIKQQAKRRRIKMVLTDNWNRNLEEIEPLDESDLSQLSDLLVEFHDEFSDVFRRAGQEESGLYYLSGLLSSIERKNTEKIALELLGEGGVRKLQRFMKDNIWYEDQMLDRLERKSAELLNAPDGMLTTDSSEFVKKGKESVGVARQYCGRLGKVENCQSGVFLGYSSEKGYSLIDGRLYLPENWFSEEKKAQWDKWDIPPDTTFKTKIEIAKEQINNMLEKKIFQIKWLGFDSFFGRDIQFLESLPNQVYFFANIPCDTQVWLEKPACEVPLYKGRGRKPTRVKLVDAERKPLTVEQVAVLELLTWCKEPLYEGAKGPIYAQMARLRVYISKNGLPGNQYWLFIRRSLDGRETKYYLSNAPVETSFEEMKKAATMRWSIEQSLKIGKSELGMADYESRSWIAWHRHMIYVFLAFLFLLMLQQRFKKNSSNHLTSGKNIDRLNFSVEVCRSKNGC